MSIKYSCVALILLILVYSSSAFTTWYVRADGGLRSQCTGTSDTPFINSTTNSTTKQNCAFGDWRFLYDTNEYLPGTYNNLTWVISGGDTVIVDNTKQWRVGYDTNTNPQPWCWGGDPFGCSNPTIPAGTAANPTKILGRNHGNCTMGSGIYQVPDPLKVSYLYGGYGVGCVLSLAGTKYVTIECLELTSHSNCSHHGSPPMPYGCSSGSPVLDDYTSNGLCTDTLTDQVTVKDVWTHGHTNAGVQGPMWGTIYVDTLRIGVVGSCGWNFDDGSHPANGPNGVGAVIGSHIIIEWSGCNQLWSEEGGHEFGYCYDQNSGGYGDGIGTPNTGAMTWICDYCVGLWNTQDAFDLGHVGGGGEVVFNNSLCYGNMASTYKSGGIDYFEVSNSISVGNCERMTMPIDGVASTYNTYLTLFCRAGGDHLSFNVLSTSNYNVRFNTIVGYNAVVADVQCYSDPCENTYNFNWQNNIEVGYLNGQYNNARGPGMWNIVVPTEQDHNLFYGLHGCPYANTTDICVESFINTTFNNQLPFIITSEAQFDTFDFSLAAGGAASQTGAHLNTGLQGAAYTTDLIGNPRNAKNPSIGALEYGSNFKMDINWWISVYGKNNARPTTGAGSTTVSSTFPTLSTSSQVSEAPQRLFSFTTLLLSVAITAVILYL